MKPRLLDLFCGAGGAAMGYSRAGFEVVGVDINPQPHYPFEFHQADAMTYPLDGFDAIHASPPCQAYSSATSLARKADHPDLYAPTRQRLRDRGLPFVIENVIGAPYDHGIVLCGSMFQPDKTVGWVQRHRNFETSWFMFQPACDHKGRPRPFTISGRGSKVATEYVHSNHSANADWPALMGMPWADPMEVKLGIPPDYTEWIGKQLLASGLAEADGSVAFDLALGDRPRLADEAGAQLPLGDLSTQRGSRHPETGSGFGEGEHLASVGEGHALGVANDLICGAVDDPNVGRLVHALEAELADAGVTGGAADGEAEALVSGLGVGHERGGDVGGGHRVLLRGGCASKVRDTAYVVKGVLS